MATVGRSLWAALTLDLHLDSPTLPLRWLAGLVIAHLGALAIVLRVSHGGWWLLPLVLVVPLVVMARQRATQINLLAVSLTPLGLLYAVTAVRIAIALYTSLAGRADPTRPVPEPYGSFLDYPTFMGLSLVWVWAAQARPLAQTFGLALDRRRALELLSAGLLLFTLAWAGITYWDVRPAGVTASDPYAYTQMAHNLATTGRLQGHFPLTATVAEAGLDLYSLVPVGYRTPDAETGLAATVWPPGYPTLLAGMYLLAGEAGFYALGPLFGWLTLLPLGGLVWEATRGWEVAYRWLAVALGLFVLATSLLQLLWLALPMADVPAQFFSALAVWLAVLAVRQDTQARLAGLAFASGLSLGVAFALRYTQVLLAISLVAAFTLYLRPGKLNNGGWKRWWAAMLATGIGAWLPALPVLGYHQATFGGPFSVGSQELNLFAVHWMGDTALRMAQEAFSGDEFLWLLPFLLWGFYHLGRTRPRLTAVLGLWLAALVAFHLPYAALRLRDLLSVFPVLALGVAIGGADGVRRAGRYRYGTLAAVLMLSLALWLRADRTLQITGGSYSNFGYLDARTRQSFDTVQSLTEDEAVIAASLHSGPLRLYSQRHSVRPYDWSLTEWEQFIALMGAEEHPLYFLRDGTDMEPVFAQTQQRYTLEAVATLPLPYFYPGGGSVVQPVTLYRIEER